MVTGYAFFAFGDSAIRDLLTAYKEDELGGEAVGNNVRLELRNPRSKEGRVAGLGTKSTPHRCRLAVRCPRKRHLEISARQVVPHKALRLRTVLERPLDGSWSDRSNVGGVVETTLKRSFTSANEAHSMPSI